MEKGSPVQTGEPFLLKCSLLQHEAPSKSPPKRETLKHFKALSFGEGWVRLPASQ
ncbi:hypothetical protein M2273_004203 [Mucilaginibacter lappiensis]